MRRHGGIVPRVLTLTLDGVEWLGSCFGRLPPAKEPTALNKQESGWAPQLVRMHLRISWPCQKSNKNPWTSHYTDCSRLGKWTVYHTYTQARAHIHTRTHARTKADSAGYMQFQKTIGTLWIKYRLRDLKFSQRCWWMSKSFGILSLGAKSQKTWPLKPLVASLLYFWQMSENIHTTNMHKPKISV
jgi:hypothetical protein